MGCCNSNLRKTNHIDIPVEERMIEASERSLLFNNKKVEDLLGLIESISFNLDFANFQSLCSHFGVQPLSSSGVFFRNLIQNKLLSTRMLRHLAIILSGLKSIDKVPLIFSLDKKIFLNSIQDLLFLAIEVVPNNLEGLEKSALLYAGSLKPVVEEYLKELRRLSIEDIKEKVEELEISSKDLRIKMYFDLQNLRASSSLDAKFEGFQKINEESEVKVEKKEDFIEENIEKTENKAENFQEVEEKGENFEEKSENFEVIKEKSEEIEEKVEKIEETSKTENPKDSESSYIEKIPESSENLSLGDDSFIIPITLSSHEKLQDLLEDPKPEDLLVDPTPEVYPPSENPSDKYLEEQKHSENPQKILTNPESEEKKIESKIPVRKSSGLAAKLKATQAFIRSSTLGSNEVVSGDIKIGLSSSQKNITFDKIKKGFKTHEEVSFNSAISLEPSLSESSLLRSVQGQTKLNSPHRDSKIGSIKGRK